MRLIVCLILPTLVIFGVIVLPWIMVPTRDEASKFPFIISHSCGGIGPDRKVEKGGKFLIGSDISTSKKCYLDKITIQVNLPPEVTLESIISDKSKYTLENGSNSY